MIVIDSSETRHIDIEATQSPILETITGADLMVTPIKLPCTTETLLMKHIESGALLVQRKAGTDLSASIGERMNSSLARMVATGARQSQCILLFIGFFTEVNGMAEINKQMTHHGYWTVQGAISKWHDRGGVVEYLPKPSLLQLWCDMKEQHLAEYKMKPEKEFWPDKATVRANSELFQTLVPVDDGRVLLATLPGIGEKTANILYKHFDGNVAEALCWLTDPWCEPKIKGIGTKTIENVRNYLNIDEVMIMGMEVSMALVAQAEGGVVRKHGKE